MLCPKERKPAYKVRSQWVILGPLVYLISTGMSYEEARKTSDDN